MTKAFASAARAQTAAEKLIQNSLDPAKKQALADKYTHLANIAGSEPKKKSFIHKATRYRRQVEQMKRDGI